MVPLVERRLIYNTIEQNCYLLSDLMHEQTRVSPHSLVLTPRDLYYYVRGTRKLNLARVDDS